MKKINLVKKNTFLYRADNKTFCVHVFTCIYYK